MNETGMSQVLTDLMILFEDDSSTNYNKAGVRSVAGAGRCLLITKLVQSYLKVAQLPPPTIYKSKNYTT